MSKTKTKTKKVLLAVDLKARDLRPTQRVWQALGSLLDRDALLVEPVSVLTREDATVGEVVRDRIGSLRTAAERHLAERLAQSGIACTENPRVLFADGSSTQREVLALLQYARRNDFDMIALSSHARSGVKRLLLGSFAETLVLQSPIPVVVVNPTCRPGPARTILFPTDFSAESRKALQALGSAYRATKVRIVLLHHFVLPVQFCTDFFGTAMIPGSLLQDEVKRLRRTGRQWRDEVRASFGLRCDFVFDRKATSVVDAVLTVANRKRVGLIAMTAQSSRGVAALVGSVTRQVLRDATQPVWVLHPGPSSVRSQRASTTSRAALSSSQRARPRRIEGRR